MIVDNDLLQLVAKEGKHTFISTGMSTHEDIQNAVKFLEKLIVFWINAYCIYLSNERWGCKFKFNKILEKNILMMLVIVIMRLG